RSWATGSEPRRRSGAWPPATTSRASRRRTRERSAARRPDPVAGEPIRVGLLGCGHVGSAVARMVHDHAEEVATRAGSKVEIARVAVRNLSKERDVDLPQDVFTHDPHEVVRDPAVDVIIEVIGGIEPARSLILEAFEQR